MRPARYALAAAFAALGAGCAISTQQELSLGQQYAAQLAKELPLVNEPRIQADLDAIAGRLTPLSRRPEVRYRFFLVNSEVVNAFAIPGGYIYVTRGVVERATSMDQLAGVLGHEMGHVEYRHSARQIGRQRAADLGVGLTSVLLQGRGQVGQVATQGAGLAAQGLLMRYSRDQEREADRAAVSFTTRAGINPDGIVEFFRTLEAIEGTEPSSVRYFFASHPLTEDRVRDVTALIDADATAREATRTGQHDDESFRDLKLRVSSLPPVSAR